MVGIRAHISFESVLFLSAFRRSDGIDLNLSGPGGSVLLRPLSPFATPASTRLPGMPVLIIDGSKDDRRTPDDGRRLVEY